MIITALRNVQKIRAGLNAHIDLSEVDTITAPYRGEDRLDILIDTGGSIDLSSLNEIASAGSGRVLIAANQGTVSLGSVYASGYLDLVLTDQETHVDVMQNLLYGASSTINGTGFAMLAIGGNYTFAHTDETKIKLENARVHMSGSLTPSSTAAPAPLAGMVQGLMPAGKSTFSTTERTYYEMLATDEFASIADDFLELAGSIRSHQLASAGVTQPAPMASSDLLPDDPNNPGVELQYFEVGCLDGGLEGALTNNFAIGQMIVGQANQVTVCYLTDLVDNGNRGTAGKECLYLAGVGDADGLRILGGSTLVVNGINVYAKMGGELVHINSLFTGGEIAIPWDQGYISIDPVFGACGDVNHPYAASDISLDCQVNLDDYAGICAQWLGADCYSPDWCDGADLNHDGVVDGLDLTLMSDSWLQ